MKSWIKLIEDLFGYRSNSKEMPDKASDLPQDRLKCERQGISQEKENEGLNDLQ